MGEDLAEMTRDHLITQVKRLRQGIREHRDSKGQQWTWPLLASSSALGLLPEKTDPVPIVPAWPQFMQECIEYRRSLHEQRPKLRAARSHISGDLSRNAVANTLGGGEVIGP